MNCLFLALAGISFVFFSFGYNTGYATVKAEHAMRIHNPGPQTATDLHFKACQKENDIYIDGWEVEVQGGGFIGACSLDPNRHCITCDYAGGSVAPCQSVVIKVKLNLSRWNSVRLKDVKWTHNDEEWDAAPDYGWVVTSIDPQTQIAKFIFHNDDPSLTLRVDSLRFKLNQNYVPIESLYHHQPTWDSPQNSFSLTPGDSEVFTLSGMQVWKYLYMAGKVVYDLPTGRMADSSQFVAEHEDIPGAQGPTLTQWGLIILVALLIASGVYVMLKRRKAAVSI